jgi:hypothetical protein
MTPLLNPRRLYRSKNKPVRAAVGSLPCSINADMLRPVFGAIGNDRLKVYRPVLAISPHRIGGKKICQYD